MTTIGGDPRHRTAGADDIRHLTRRHIPSAADLVEADGPLRCALAVAAGLARSEGIADGGYRLISNVGRWVARRWTISTST